MKLAFSTLGCPSWDFEKIIKEASKNGFKGIELRGVQEEIYLPKVKAFLKENQRKTLKTIEDHGLVITDLGSGLSLHDPNNYDKAIQEGKDYIDLAQQLKVPYIRIFGDKIPDPSKKYETISLISKGINELCDYGSYKNVSCLLETHGDIVGLENLEPILNQIKHKNFGLIWDVGHTYKVYGNDLSEFLDKTWEYIKHVHIKDLIQVNNELELCLVGKGEVPIPDLIEELRARNYQGYLSLEWEKRWHDFLEEPEIALPLYADYMIEYIGLYK